MGSEAVPAFGQRLPEHDYQQRPSAYVVVRDSQRRVAVVRAPQGVFLPGGGITPGESAEEAALREAREECGLRVDALSSIGVAEEYLYSEHEATYFVKRSRFFRGSVTDSVPNSEPDHELAWVPQDQAERQLTHGSIVGRWSTTPPNRR